MSRKEDHPPLLLAQAGGENMPKESSSLSTFLSMDPKNLAEKAATSDDETFSRIQEFAEALLHELKSAKER
jgi:hypothetical protein